MTDVLTIKTGSMSKVEQNGYKFCLNLGQAKKYLEIKFRNSEISQFLMFHSRHAYCAFISKFENLFELAR